MQAAVLSYDFLISSAYCCEDNIEVQIENLVEIRRLLCGFGDRPLLENEILEKLIEADCYPAERMFKNNLTKCKVDSYSAKDIAKLVNSILEHAESISSAIPERLTDWLVREFRPNFLRIPLVRKGQLEDLVEQIGLGNVFGSKDRSILHYCQDNLHASIALDGIIKNSIPDCGNYFPAPFHTSARIYVNFKAYLADLNLQSLILQAKLAADFKYTFYVAALKKIKDDQRDLSIVEYEKFQIGDFFLESLKANQCMPGQKFFNVILGTVVKIIADLQVGQMTPFNTEAGGNKARMHAGFRAYREHVTKSALGLRLMYWRNAEGLIIFANVGPKQQLTIKNPFAI